MSERKRVLLLILIMATASLIVAGITIFVLYRAAYEEEGARLVEIAQSQARLIEAVARFDAVYSKHYSEGSEAATLSQIVDAHKYYKGFGETGEFTLARREGDSIVFLLSHRHYDLKYLKPVPFDSGLAEPMRRALSGMSGTGIGFDYRGEVVLAAYEPVAELNLGIVAKIDLAEIRMPFVRAGLIAAGLAILVVLSGAVLFLRVSNPIIKRLEKHTAELARANEQLKQEIDERKRAEAQIVQTKQEWERTFDVVPDLIMILDNEYRIVQVNKAMTDRLGSTSRDLVGQICYEAFHGTKDPVALCPHARLMVDGLSHTAEVHDDRVGGDFLVSVNPLHDPNGKLVGSVHVARDITERKQAEDALRESEKRYRDLYENAPNAYFSISAVDGSVLRCNSAALQLLGYDKETITKMRVLDLYADTPHGISKAKEILKRFQAGESIRDVELQMKRKDGQPIWISLTVEPLKDRDGNVIESRSMVINISERKQAEEALQKAHDELEQKVEERTAELKREIRERKQAEKSLRKSENHLRHLSSQLLTAQENERKRIALELHDGIGQSLSALKFGVENSLKQMDKGASRPIIKPLEAVIPIIQESIEEVRKIAMDLRPATLDDLGILATIGWFCREFQTIYGGIRIEKQMNIEENEVPELQKTVIYRVMQEAMNNIAKHSKADLVRLSLRKTDSVIELVIEDNGLGFDLEDAFSLEPARKGIGLSSMKERTELSGGSFAIESGKGAGTIVRAIWRPMKS